MTNTKFKLGPVKIDAQAYGSQGNAILGIRDSGKTYTATEIAELLFEAGIPWICFDVTGVWRFLRVPGAGRGYPIVVAGGKSADLPLNVTGAVEIVRAAMKNGVSLVIDLTDPKLSKADWKRIVKSCVRTLLQENAEHGLRHIFIEEAAEFAPQKVLDGDVYAEVEKLARVGGNSRLGYTLINQRSQEVNKAVLELCENLFLHRQKGKNAIQSLDHWLGIAGVDQKEIIASLPDLPSGQCWAWMGGQRPVLVKVPPKNSFHPDRRAMFGETGKRSRKAVDVGSFVADMKTALVALEEEFKANDVPTLRKRIAELEAAGKRSPAADSQAVSQAEARGYRRGLQETAAAYGKFGSALVAITAAVTRAQNDTDRQEGVVKEQLQSSGLPTGKTTTVHTPRPAPAVIQIAARSKPSPAPTGGDGSLIGGPEQKIIDAIRWWNVLGIAAPSHAQTAFVAGYSHKSGSWATYLSRLRSKGLIEGRGDLVLTAAGAAVAVDPDAPPSTEALHRAVLGKIDGPMQRILAPLIEVYPNGLTHPEAAERSGYSHSSGSWATYLSRLRSLDLIAGRGELKAEPWLFAA